jgi:hypothetical protein
MSDPTSSAVDEKSPAEAATDVGAPLPKTDAERIRSAVARLTSNSIDGLEALSSASRGVRASQIFWKPVQ